MILRRFPFRHYRKALFSQASVQCKRRLETEAHPNVSSIEAAVNQTVRETDSVIEEIDTSGLRRPELQKELAAAEAQAKLESYQTLQHIKQTTGYYGSEIEPHYSPKSLLDNPPRPADVTLELLLASQAHFGHSTSLWNPSNSRYIFGIRSGIHIISLEITLAHLRRAAKVVSAVAERGGTTLFVGTRKGQDRFVVRAAQLAGACHLFERWIPGGITNKERILGRCAIQVIDEFDRPVRGFESQMPSYGALTPDLVVCFNPLENHNLLAECGQKSIPTIGIIDTDADPTWVTYPIPANDDSLRTVGIIAGALGRAGEEGQKKRKDIAKGGNSFFGRPPNLRAPTRDEVGSVSPVELDESGAEEGKVTARSTPIEQIDSNDVVEEEHAKRLENIKQRLSSAIGEDRMKGAVRAIGEEDFNEHLLSLDEDGFKALQDNLINIENDDEAQDESGLLNNRKDGNKILNIEAEANELFKDGDEDNELFDDGDEDDELLSDDDDDAVDFQASDLPETIEEAMQKSGGPETEAERHEAAGEVADEIEDVAESMTEEAAPNSKRKAEREEALDDQEPSHR